MKFDEKNKPQNDFIKPEAVINVFIIIILHGFN